MGLIRMVSVFSKIRIFQTLALLVFQSTVSVSAVAAEKVIFWNVDESKVEIRLGYTLGTHVLQSSAMTGQLKGTESSFESTTGQLLVPIREIKEGSQKLECHMQSALGLDYNTSKFPKEHVCDSNNLLPTSGPDSIVFPEIRLTINGLKKISEEDYEIEGQWNIHGVSQNVSNLKVKIERKDDKVVASGSSQFRLSDFGIVVKRAFVISVSEVAEMKFSITFKKSQTTDNK